MVKIAIALMVLVIFPAVFFAVRGWPQSKEKEQEQTAALAVVEAVGDYGKKEGGTTTCTTRGYKIDRLDDEGKLEHVVSEAGSGRTLMRFSVSRGLRLKIHRNELSNKQRRELIGMAVDGS